MLRERDGNKQIISLKENTWQYDQNIMFQAFQKRDLVMFNKVSILNTTEAYT